MKNFLGFVAVIAVGCAVPAIAEDQYILKTITCPYSVKVKLDMADHIGSDPEFSVAGGNAVEFPKLTSISRVDQKITCSYKLDAGISGTYSYTAKRKLLSCNQKDHTTLECKIKL